MNEPDTEFRQLTARQRQCLLFIVSHYRKHLRSPSLREICEHMQLKSINGARGNIDALVRKGYVVRDPLLSRTIAPVGLRVVYEPPPELDPHVFGDVTKPSSKPRVRVVSEPKPETDTPSHLTL